jgi:hypothetical protein
MAIYAFICCAQVFGKGAKGKYFLLHHLNLIYAEHHI